MRRISPDLRIAAVLAGFACALPACSTYRPPPVTRYEFPKNVYLDPPQKPFEKLGQVRTQVNFSSLQPDWSDEALCRNFYNKAAADLLARAKENGGEAVMGMRSVVFLLDGKSEVYRTPECSDDGEGGQILAQGIAIRWKKAAAAHATPAAPTPAAKETPVEPLSIQEQLMSGPLSRPKVTRPAAARPAPPASQAVPRTPAKDVEESRRTKPRRRSRMVRPDQAPLIR